MSNNPPSILIVDDSAVTRTMIKRTIGMTGLEVGRIHEAADGKAALELMRSHPMDLVLADLNMPVMDGSEMIHQMSGDDALKKIPVVVISAQPDQTKVARLKEQGVVGYLAKPFTPEGLRDLICPVVKGPECERYAAAEAEKAEESFNMTLLESLAEALEVMAFVSPELPESPWTPVASPELRIIRVGFHDAKVRGSLALAASEEFGSTIAGNCGDEHAVADANDALKELANVTCGSLLRRREGGGGV